MISYFLGSSLGGALAQRQRSRQTTIVQQKLDHLLNGIGGITTYRGIRAKSTRCSWCDSKNSLNRTGTSCRQCGGPA